MLRTRTKDIDEEVLEVLVKLQDHCESAGREGVLAAPRPGRKENQRNGPGAGVVRICLRRLGLCPLGQITRDLNSAPSKIKDLEAALARAEEGCRSLEAAIALMKEQVEMMKKAMTAAGP